MVLAFSLSKSKLVGIDCADYLDSTLGFGNRGKSGLGLKGFIHGSTIRRGTRQSAR